MFGWEFPPHNSGGLGVACEGLVRGLSHHGINIHFVLPRVKKDLRSSFCELVFADLEKGVEKIPVDSPLTPYVTSATYSSNISKETSTLKNKYEANLVNEVKRYAKQARNIASNRQAGVVHAHDWLSFPAGINAKDVNNKPLVAHIHATEFDRTGGNNINPQVFEIEKDGLHKSDKVIAVSEFTKNILVDEYKIRSDKIEVVHNGFDNEATEEEEGEPSLEELKRQGKKVVLFLGRLTLQKGPDYFLRAARKILEYDPNVVFVMAGSGDMERQLIREAAHLNIADKVLFPGFLRGKKLWQVYHAADLYVMPSVSEPFGISPLEALSRNTPTLISKQAGVSEVLSHTIKADFWDTEKMADKMISILNYSELHSELTQNGKQELERITWQKAAEKCVKIYQNLLTGRTSF